MTTDVPYRDLDRLAALSAAAAAIWALKRRHGVFRRRADGVLIPAYGIYNKPLPRPSKAKAAASKHAAVDTVMVEVAKSSFVNALLLPRLPVRPLVDGRTYPRKDSSESVDDPSADDDAPVMSTAMAGRNSASLKALSLTADREEAAARREHNEAIRDGVRLRSSPRGVSQSQFRSYKQPVPDHVTGRKRSLAAQAGFYRSTMHADRVFKLRGACAPVSARPIETIAADRVMALARRPLPPIGGPLLAYIKARQTVDMHLRMANMRRELDRRQSIGDPLHEYQPDPRESKSPRLAKLSDDLEELFVWRQWCRMPGDVIGTNWSIVPKNGEFGEDVEQRPDDDDEDGEAVIMNRDRHLDARPTAEEMLALYGDGTDIDRGQRSIGHRRKSYVWRPKVSGAAIRVGGLRFSDAAHASYNPGETPLTIGKMTHYNAGPNRLGFPTVFKFGEQRGADPEDDRSKSRSEDIRESNEFHSETLGTLPARYITGGKHGNRRSFTKFERLMLRFEQVMVAAIEQHPPTKYPPGLPCGSRRVAESFLGFICGTSFQSGSTVHRDELSDRQLVGLVRAALSAQDIKTLDRALDAQKLEDIGALVCRPDAHESTKLRKGRKELRRAVRSLRDAIRRYI